MEKTYKTIDKDFVIKYEDYANQIGRGSFADVFRCHKLLPDGSLSDEKLVAKRINYQSGIPEMKELIRREITIMLKLDSISNLHTVKIYHHFESLDEKSYFIIMEYCEGGDLEQYSEKDGPFTEEEIRRILFPVAECIDQMHKQGMIHRDLKLANILLKSKPEPGSLPEIRLTDFGLAFQVSQKNNAQTQCGTPLFMAPEIWNPTKKGYSNKVDVWSFGNLLYKLMFGEHIFQDENVKEKIKEGVIRFPKVRFVSLQCFDLMLKCLRKIAEKRPSFEEILSHPFFIKPDLCKPMDFLFDGTPGYFEISLFKEHDLLKTLDTLHLSGYEPDIFEVHNEEVFRKWAVD